MVVLLETDRILITLGPDCTTFLPRSLLRARLHRLHSRWHFPHSNGQLGVLKHPAEGRQLPLRRHPGPLLLGRGGL